MWHEKMSSMHAYRSLGFRSLGHTLFGSMKMLPASENSKQKAYSCVKNMCSFCMFGIWETMQTICIRVYLVFMVLVVLTYTSEMVRRNIYRKLLYNLMSNVHLESETMRYLWTILNSAKHMCFTSIRSKETRNKRNANKIDERKIE